MIEAKINLEGTICVPQTIVGEVNKSTEFITPITQDKAVEPSKEEQIITPDDGFTGLSKVTVSGVNSSIDENIKSENIKEGIEILGVAGSLKGADEILLSILDGTANTIDVPKSLTSIKKYAFYQSTNLVNVNFKENIEDINDNAFNGSGLTSLKIDKTNSKTALKIFTNVFNGCKSLQTVDINIQKQLYLGTNTFYGCSNLKTVNIEAGTNLGIQFYNQSTNAGSNQFQNCTLLENVRFVGASAIDSYFGSNMFSGCKNLKTVRFDKPVSSFSIRQSYSYVFQNCTQSDLVIYIDKPRATVESWTGYAEKWGATNAKIICNDDADWIEYIN